MSRVVSPQSRIQRDPRMMSVSSAIATVALAIAASFALSLALDTAASGQDSADTGLDDFEVVWAYRPEDLADLTQASPAVVLAEVEAVRGGPTEVSDPLGGASNAPRLPSELIDMRLVEAVNGSTPESFTLYQTGAPGARPAEAPAYRVGERYLLFVRPRLNDQLTAPNLDGTWIAVAPDGRLERLPSGALDATIPGAVAEDLDGASVPEAIEQIEEVVDEGAGA